MADLKTCILAAALAGLVAPLGAPAPARAFDNRIQHTDDLPTYALRQARKRMLAKRHISYADMRALADHGDGLAAFRYGKRLLELEDPSLLSDAAHYFSIAAMTGREYAVTPLVRILQRPGVEINDVRMRDIERSLWEQARNGDPDASRALAEFYTSGTPFGKKPDRAEQLLENMPDDTDPRDALDLAVAAMNAPEDQRPDKERLLDLLETAMNSKDLEVKLTAENMFRAMSDPERIAGRIDRPALRPDTLTMPTEGSR